MSPDELIDEAAMRWFRLYQFMDQECRNLNRNELVELRAKLADFGQTNCWFAKYQMAPMLDQEAKLAMFHGPESTNERLRR